MAKSARIVHLSAGLAVLAAAVVLQPPPVVAAQTSAATPADAVIDLERTAPVRVVPVRGTFAGRTLGGRIERWSDASFIGTFEGTRLEVHWIDCAPLDVHRIRTGLIDALRDRDARRARFLDLATFLWSVDGGDRFADRAATAARRLGADDAALAAARTAAAELRARREAGDARAQAFALRQGAPEADAIDPARPIVVWPELDDAQRAAATTSLRTLIAGAAAALGRDLVAVESTHALAASDLGTGDGARRAAYVDELVVRMLPALGRSADERPFAGRIVVFTTSDAARFALLNASQFRRNAAAASPQTPARTLFVHCDDERVAIVQLVQPAKDGAEPTAATPLSPEEKLDLALGVARGLLHRHRTSGPLPRWFAEGLVDWLATLDRTAADLDAVLRPPGLRFIRAGGSLEQVLGAGYVEGRFPQDDLEQRAAGYLVVRFIAEREHARLVRSLDLLKLEGSGGDAGRSARDAGTWRPLVERGLGTTIASLLAEIRRHHQVND
jgi:hypothetical protein